MQNTMDKDSRHFVIALLIELIAFLIIAFIYNGSVVFDPRVTIFSYLIFGVTIIILYNVLQFRSLTEFFALAAGITIMVLATFFKSLRTEYILRNALWFVFITGSVFGTNQVLNTRFFRRSSYVSLTVWMFSCAVIYVCMTLLNIFAFSFYPVAYTRWFLLRATALGFSMGLGIGLGYEIYRKYGRWLADLLFRKTEE